MSIELVVGLGNPGRRYAATRHNLGFLVVDELARRHRDAPWAHHPLGDVVSTAMEPRLILAKPRTYMNRSGRAVEWLVRLLALAPEQVLVAVDDVELVFGTIRLRRSGGPGTHNGLRDICSRIGDAYPRLRVGVRGAEPGDLADYVLSPFTDDESAHLAAIVERAVASVESALRDGLDRAMSRFNRPFDDRV